MTKAMLTEDYLIRLINQAVAALAQVLGLKTAGQYRAAHDTLDQMLELVFGLRADLIKRLDDDSLLAALSPGSGPDTDRLYLAAELFRARADVYAAQGESGEAQVHSLRALNFFLETVLNGGARHYQDAGERIAALLQGLAGFPLPQETLFALFCYYEDTGSYAAGEKALLRLAESPELVEEMAAQLIEYYGRLLEKPELELAQGGLSHAQVQENLAKLQE